MVSPPEASVDDGELELLVVVGLQPRRRRVGRLWEGRRPRRAAAAAAACQRSRCCSLC